MSDPLSKQATAIEIARAVMSGKVKAVAVVEAALTRIETSEATDQRLHRRAGRAGEASAPPRSMPAGIAGRWSACPSRSRTCST